MYNNRAELLEIGMNGLVKMFGIVGAEEFITTIRSDEFNYTEWQREHYDSMSREELESKAVAYDQANPFTVQNA